MSVFVDPVTTEYMPYIGIRLREVILEEHFCIATRADVFLCQILTPLQRLPDFDRFLLNFLHFRGCLDQRAFCILDM